MTRFHPAHLYSPLTLQDITGPLAAVLPPSAKELVRAIGADAALLLMGRWGGVQIPNIPKTPTGNPHGARRWALLAETIGEPAMQRLATAYGGRHLDVPLCRDLRLMRRNHALIAEFDTLSKDGKDGKTGLSKNKAVEILVLMFAPITYRQVEQVLDTVPSRDLAQTPLFD
jgi:hypothetical protein